MPSASQKKMRYARQVALPEIGEAGQRRLAEASVAIIGAGGLGSPAAYYLAAAGVGKIGLVDPDRVDVTNLQRQILHFTTDIGRAKTVSARRKLLALNPETGVETHAVRLDRSNTDRVVGRYDFVVDATDNFESKFLIADSCHAMGKPCVHGGIRGFEGQLMTVLPGRTACYRCVFDAPPPAKRGKPRGPLGVVPGVIGTLQAAEAIKWILRKGELMTDCLLVFDALAGTFRRVAIKRNPKCRLCGRATCASL